MIGFTSNGPDHSPWDHTHPAGTRHPWEESPSVVYHTAGHYHKGQAVGGSHVGRDRRSRGGDSRPWAAGGGIDILSRDHHSSPAAVGDAPDSSRGIRLDTDPAGGCNPAVGHVGHSRQRGAGTGGGLENGTGGDLWAAYLAGSAFDVSTRSALQHLLLACWGRGFWTYVGDTGDRVTLKVAVVQLLYRGAEISCTFKLNESAMPPPPQVSDSAPIQARGV